MSDVDDALKNLLLSCARCRVPLKFIARRGDSSRVFMCNLCGFTEMMVTYEPQTFSLEEPDDAA